MKLRNAEQNNTNVPCRTCFSLEREHFVRFCPERSSTTCKTKNKVPDRYCKISSIKYCSCISQHFLSFKAVLQKEAGPLTNTPVTWGCRDLAEHLCLFLLWCIKDHGTAFSGIMWLRKWHSHLRSPRSLTPDWLLLSAAPLKADLAAQRTCKWSLWDLWPAIRLW